MSGSSEFQESTLYQHVSAHRFLEAVPVQRPAERAATMSTYTRLRFLHQRTEVFMADASEQSLLSALLDSWDRDNTIMLNLLHALPEGGPEAKAMVSSPSVAQHFTHIHHERLVSVLEEAPEFATDVPEEEWLEEREEKRIAQMLEESAEAVRDAVKGGVLAGRDMDLNYDHPILMLQLMLWHEGYHHGQIKLALELAGYPISDEEAGPGTWDVWRGKGRVER